MLLPNLHEQFVRERRFLKNVSPRTEEWYRQSFRAFLPALENRSPGDLSKANFIEQIAAMKGRGLSATSINTFARSINAFLNWMREEGYLQTAVRISRLKEESKVIAPWSAEDAGRLLRYSPRDDIEQRVQVIALLILDTGLRLNEALSLKPEDLDLDNLLVRVREAKGGRQRTVPCSPEIRRVLTRYMKTAGKTDLIFGARTGSKLLRGNVGKNLAGLCDQVPVRGVKPGFHTLRHYAEFRTMPSRPRLIQPNACKDGTRQNTVPWRTRLSPETATAS